MEHNPKTTRPTAFKLPPIPEGRIFLVSVCLHTSNSDDTNSQDSLKRALESDEYDYQPCSPQEKTFLEDLLQDVELSLEDYAKKLE